MEKNIKKSYKNNTFLKYHLKISCGMKIGITWEIKRFIRYSRIFRLRIYARICSSFPHRIYVSKIENRIKFEIKKGSHLQFLMPETIKLLGTTKSKMTKNEIFENVPHLEIT